MMRQIFLLCFSALLFGAATCERPVDLDFPDPDPQLVVISNFTANKAIRVQVSESRSVLGQAEEQYVRDAKVEVYQGEQLLEELKLMAPPGQPPYYTTIDLRPETGVTYLIRVSAPGYPTAVAESHIPASTAIASLGISDLVVTELPDEHRTEYAYRISLSFIDPAGQDNFYHLQFHQQILNYQYEEGDTLITGGYLRPIEFDPAGDNNEVTTYFDGGLLFEDTPFNGQRVTYNFGLRTDIQPKRELLGKMFAELRTVSEEYYLFHSSLSRQQDNPGAPFAEPVIVYNNIDNGRGIFAGYNVSMDSVMVSR